MTVPYANCLPCHASNAVTIYRCDACYSPRDEERAPCWNCGMDEIVTVERYCEAHGHGILDGHFCFERGCPR